MKVKFKELEDYLLKFGYPRNELMKTDCFIIPEMTSYQYTMKNIAEFSGYDAMTYFGKKISYDKLPDLIDSSADMMKTIGLTEDDRVATLLPNMPEALYMQYGPSKIGCAVSNIDPRTSAVSLLKYVEREKIKNIVILDLMYENAIRPIERELKERFNIDKIIVVPVSNSMPLLLKGGLYLKNGNKKISSDILEILYWDDLMHDSRFTHAQDVGFTPGRIDKIQHSSGTSSGIPKSIPLTNENVNMFVEKHRPTEFSEIKPGTKLLHVLPYFAAYGAINSAHLGINFGLTLQNIPEFSFKDFGYIAYKNKSEILIGVPNWYNAFTRDNRLRGNCMKNVIMAISGGDSNTELSKKEDDDFLLSHGAKCIETNGHGMSELAGSGTYTFRGHQTGLSVGIPFPYDKYIVVDSNGNIVPVGSNGVKGNVYIYSPSATCGSFDNVPFAETMDIKGFKFINSGDTMFIAPNYEITFISREDRTFTRFDGHKVIPADVENKILQINKVKQCMVVPYEDEKYFGKMPIAYVVPSSELSEDEKYSIVEQIANIILSSTELTSREVPRKVSFIDLIPQSQMSKNDYRQLINREIDGSEYIIDLDETNLSVKSVNIIGPKKQDLKKVRRLST